MILGYGHFRSRPEESAYAGPCVKTITIVAIAVVGLGAALAGDPLSAEDSGRACYPPNTRTLLVTKEVRVFDYRRAGTKRVCRRATGETDKLDDRSSGYWTFPPPALAVRGNVMAKATLSDDLDGLNPRREITIRWRRLDRREFGPALDFDERRGIGSLRLKPNTSLAYITCPVSIDVLDPPESPPETCRRPNGRFVYRVYKVESDRPETPVVLDRGRKIDPDSLQLRGSTLTWQEGKSATRSAILD